MTEIRGLAYPLQLDSRGRLKLAEDLVVVEQNIMSVLETRPYERVMRADYGWDPGIMDTLEPTAINAHIYMAVTEQVPEVTDLQVVGNVADEGTYNVKLRYGVNGVPQPPLELTLNL